MLYRNSTDLAEGWAARALPGMALAGLILLSALPTPFDQRPLPDLVLIAVYLASVRRPPAVSAPVLFGLGLLHDLLSAVPVGLHAFVYVLVYGLASNLPLDPHRLSHLWLGFVPVAALAAAASWFAVSVYHVIWLAPDPMLARAAASIVVFPLLAFVLTWVLWSRRDEP